MNRSMIFGGALAALALGACSTFDPSGETRSAQAQQQPQQQQQAQQQQQSQQAVAAPAGEDLVRNVQQALEKRGIEAGPIDGIWGPQTAQALREFQQANGLEATGRLDGKTLSALGIAGQGSAAAGGTGGAAASAARAGMATQDVEEEVQFQRQELGK